jgi:O-antigen ligase
VHPSKSGAGIYQRTLPLLYILLSLYAFPISSYISEFSDASTNLISIAARALSAVVALSFFIYVIKKRALLRNLDFWVFILFWILYSMRIIYDISRNSSSLGRDPADYLLFAIVISFISTIPSFNSFDYSSEALERLVLIILIVLCLAGIYYFHFGGALEVILRGQSRASGNERLNPISFSIFSTCLVAVSLKRVLLTNVQLGSVLISVVAACVGAYTLLLSSSRGPMLFLGLFTLLLLCYSFRSNQLKTVVVFSFLTIGIYTAIKLTGFQSIAKEMFVERFNSVTGSAAIDESTEGRVQAYAGAFKQFVDSPIVGSFLEEHTLQQYPHNVLLESFMALGIVGGIVFLIIYLRYLFYSIVGLFISGFSVLFIIALANGVLVMTSGALSFSTEFWLSFGLISTYFSKRRISAGYGVAAVA